MAELDQTIQEKPEAVVVAGDSDDDQKPIFNNRQVQDVVKREREKALKKGREMALEELQAQQAAQQQQPSVSQPAPQPQAPQQMGGMSQQNPEQIRQMIAEETAKQSQAYIQHQQAAVQAENFVAKMKAAEARYPGLEAKLEKLNWQSMGPVIKLLETTPNPGDIMHELVSHPSKMGSILGLAHAQPQMAESMMKELSDSILANQKAVSQEIDAPEPLDQMSPSNVGSDTGIKGSIRDFKNKYRG